MSKFIKQVESIRKQMAEYKERNNMSFYLLGNDIRDVTKRNISTVTINQFLNGSQPSIESLITYEMYLELAP